MMRSKCPISCECVRDQINILDKLIVSWCSKPPKLESWILAILVRMLYVDYETMSKCLNINKCFFFLIFIFIFIYKYLFSELFFFIYLLFFILLILYNNNYNKLMINGNSKNYGICCLSLFIYLLFSYLCQVNCILFNFYFILLYNQSSTFQI